MFHSIVKSAIEHPPKARSCDMFFTKCLTDSLSEDSYDTIKYVTIRHSKVLGGLIIF